MLAKDVHSRWGFVAAGCLLAVLAMAMACIKKMESGPGRPPMVTPGDTMPSSTTIKYLALGDSYTIGTEVQAKDRYPEQTAALLAAKGMHIAAPDIIAANGWTTADLLNGINQSHLQNNYDVVSLLIGVNNQYQGGSLEDYQQQFTALVQRSITLAGNRPGRVFIISIPDYSVTPFVNKQDKKAIAAAIEAFNLAGKTIAGKYRVNYLDITASSRGAADDPSLLAADSLHFSGKEYYIWAGLLAPMIKTALG